MLKLHTAPGTIGLACEIALAEAGAAYEVRRLNFAENEQRQEAYLALNPKSRVPALETDRGVITEAPAIMGYIARTHPAAALMPEGDAFAMAQAESLMSYLCSWAHPAAAHRHRGYRWADDPAAIADMRRKAPEVFGEAMRLIDERLFRGPWALGEAYSVCDPYLYVLTGWLPRDTLDMADFPRLADHHARVGARPATRAVLTAVQAG
ncbi:MAG: glutathione S-transferase family protein [Phenylobacterium sp.]|uniref:glutathione S-transferase family protein n=1 Tax=Phenylobacterium sp. TaxID=1871053 RepID=UPI001A43FA1B|nr:glutathione S-transferase family protein [Phenylobacterium sp.]MBL8553475.1 glutathione S-transferase family protein [Phenylobacterium sp.]